MIDADLADLYQVTTGNLNLAAKRNLDHFPEGFMFQLAKKKFDTLRFQSAISNRGGRRYLPYAFTEHGAAMLSSMLSGFMLATLSRPTEKVADFIPESLANLLRNQWPIYPNTHPDEGAEDDKIIAFKKQDQVSHWGMNKVAA
jgi:hypothetical protein